MHPLEHYRRTKNLSMPEMSTFLGCKLSAYKSWIYGWRCPSARNLLKIEQKAGITADQVLKSYRDLQTTDEAKAS